MKRRQFITGFGSAAAWPLAARAQQPAMPVVGYLDAKPPDGGTAPGQVAAFRKGLSEAGYVEGRNVTIEFRWANNDESRLPELAADLVRQRVTVIAAPVSTTTALVAKAATTTIPIVFGGSGDPVQAGLIGSLNRPGGNVTGFSNMAEEITAKRLVLLHDLLPKAARFAVLLDPRLNPVSVNTVITEVRAAASITHTEVEVLKVSNNQEIDAAFAGLSQKGTEALLVSPSPLFGNRNTQLVTLAAHHRVPVMYYDRFFPEAGGLMSYGASITEQARQVGFYVGRVLKGEKPADLPVVQSVKFEFVINLQTAKVLDIQLPPGLLAIADEVIE